MKKHILLILLSICYVLIAMNNNDTRPVRFDSPPVLYYRLHFHDKKHNTFYAAFAEKCKLHDSLGDTIRLRSEASIIIMKYLKNRYPDMTESQMIEHKRNIMNALRPELSQKSAKL